MSVSSAYKDYEVFLPQKLVRTGILRDTLQRGGKVWAQKLEGSALMLPLAAKLAEELQEMQMAPTDHVICQEWVDVSEALLLAQTVHTFDVTGRSTNLSLLDMIQGWEEFILSNEGVRSRLSYEWLCAETHAVLMSYAEQIPKRNFGIRSEDLDKIRQAKRNNPGKGPLEGYFLSAVAVPQGSELASLFAAKAPRLYFPETLLDERRALQPHHLAAA